MADGLKIPVAHEGASPFWKFSLKFYSQKPVPSACLTLQDGAGVDVNVMLFALFLASQGRALSTADMRAIDGAVADWRVSAVVSLRTARRFLKEPPATFDNPATATLRDRVKAIELEAERLQQEALYALKPIDAWGAAAPASRDTAAGNMAAYEAVVGKAFDKPAVEALLTAQFAASA